MKSVLPPPGSVMVRFWVITLRLQKLPLDHHVALRGRHAVILVQPAHGQDHDAAIGHRVKHVCRIAQHRAAGDVLRHQRLSRTVRLSASRMDRTGGPEAAGVEEEPIAEAADEAELEEDEDV